MARDEFTKLFTYMQREFALINEKLDQKAEKKQVDKLLGAVSASQLILNPTTKNC